MKRTRIIHEAQIHKAVVQHWKELGYPGTFLGTIPNMGAMGQAGLTKGLPDLIVIGHEVHGYIELKSDTGELSPHQKAFQSLCELRGIPFYVTYGREEPIKLLENLGIVKRRAA